MASTPKKSRESSFRKGDEVMTVCGGKLVFGTLEHPLRGPGGEEEWNVCWNDDIWGVATPRRTSEIDMVASDRALYRGCKVRRSNGSSDLIGVCRAVTLAADIRIVGTTTVLPSINSNDLSHIKEFKQKSVVYERGWLGVISDVTRTATVRTKDGQSHDLPLRDLLGVVPNSNSIESPWINEWVKCSQTGFAKLRKEMKGDPKVVDNSTPPSTADWSNRVYLEDIQVLSVGVTWRYQLDLMSPDKPPSTYTGARLKSLNVVKEDLCSESTFHVGNLCRYKIRADSEFVAQPVYDRKFVGDYFPSRLEQLDPKLLGERAYDKDPEGRLAPDNVCVVELVHLVGTGDIIWQDSSMEFVPSLDLVVLDDSLLDNVLIPGDFMFSKEFKRSSEDVYAVVQRTDLKNKMVYLRLLSCKSPAQVLDNNLCLPESSIIPHPRYKYFNETNTIAVLHNQGCNRVGHVQGTNLVGKVSVKWRDTGKEEWCWPADCSVFSVKGCDLECIVNLVITEDEVSQEPKSKLQVIVCRLQEITKVWNNARAFEEAYLRDTISSLRLLVTEALMVESLAAQKGEFFSLENISDDKLKKMNALATEYFNSTDIFSNDCPELRSVLEAFTSQFIAECKNAITKLAPDTPTTSVSSSMETISEQRNENPPSEPMDIDDPVSSPDTPGSSNSIAEETELPSVQTEFPDCFRPNVVVEDVHPENHVYTKSASEQQHLRFFIKVVKDELNNLRDSCPPGIKVKAYGSRYDVFSIMICGPRNTPYENSLYLFDASLPATYPSVPPKFHFHSFGAGRLNPNLYEEGKVCVSLLGTWSSPLQQEKWTKESNIVQVLLSIQALILVNEPYHNEPGLEADKKNAEDNKTRCLAYNTVLMPKVAQMMINHLKNPMEPWKEEIHSFYRENIPKFIKRWEKWLNIKKPKASGTGDSGREEDDEPSFAIKPISANLKTAMTTRLKELEALHGNIPEPEQQ